MLKIGFLVPELRYSITTSCYGTKGFGKLNPNKFSISYVDKAVFYKNYGIPSNMILPEYINLTTPDPEDLDRFSPEIKVIHGDSFSGKIFNNYSGILVDKEPSLEIYHGKFIYPPEGHEQFTLANFIKFEKTTNIKGLPKFSVLLSDSRIFGTGIVKEQHDMIKELIRDYIIDQNSN